jgi:tight adherence protein B
LEFIIIGFGIFITMVLVIELCSYAYRHSQIAQKKGVRKRLKKIESVSSRPPIDIFHRRVLSDITALDWLLQRTPGIRQLDRLIEQSDAKFPVGYYLLISLFLAVIGWLGGILISKHPALPFILAAVGGLTPCVVLSGKKEKRAAMFQHQLPEALDLVSRALKAGHAFASGMQLAAKEFSNPLGKEFQKVVDEVNFGVSMQEALGRLGQRIDSAELQFFVVSVILQRETGGNLSEILNNLANLLRERFKLQGKIRVLSAEGRLSAIILVLLPFLLMAFFHLRNPEYLAMLWTEPAGRIMATSGAILMVIGIMVIKRMVNIRV